MYTHTYIYIYVKYRLYVIRLLWQKVCLDFDAFGIAHDDGTHLLAVRVANGTSTCKPTRVDAQGSMYDMLHPQVYHLKEKKKKKK
jgi:hypothetical protein